MKTSKFSDAQKAFVLKQAEDGVPVAEVCRKAGISQATFFNWKKKYGGMLPNEMRRLKQLEDENRRLKSIVADLSLDKEMLQDVIKRKLCGLLSIVSWLIVCGMSGINRSVVSVRYCPLIVPPITINPSVLTRPV